MLVSRARLPSIEFIIDYHTALIAQQQRQQAEQQAPGADNGDMAAQGPATAPSKHSVSRGQWEERMAGVGVDKAAMNRAVMGYLVTEGLVDAARCFQQETGVEPDVPLASIAERRAIRDAVQAGRIEAAIERANDLNPEVLDTHPRVLFRLQQHRLIELIRGNRVEEALAFAQEELAPQCEEEPSLLEDLEATMALLLFESVAEAERSPVGHLLDAGQRQRTAAELNAAILAGQQQDACSKVPRLLKMILWMQQQLDAKSVAFPHMKELALATLEDP